MLRNLAQQFGFLPTNEFCIAPRLGISGAAAAFHVSANPLLTLGPVSRLGLVAAKLEG